MSQRGWVVFTEQSAAEDMERMPPALRATAVRFLVDLAPAVGAALDTGASAPGFRVGEGRHGTHVPEKPLMIQYTIDESLREVRVFSVVWVH